MKKIIINWMLMIFLVITGTSSFAHCDTRNGPVIKAARQALQTNNVNLILIWVQPKDETELKTAFAKVMQVRKKDKEAEQLADEYFFETAVRLHRMGEGEPYTGIKDEPVEPYILSADKALERKSSDSLLFEMKTLLQQGLDSFLLAVLKTQSYNPNDVKAGRMYVENYVRFLHYVEVLHTNASKKAIAHNEQEAGVVATGNENNKQQPPAVSTVTNTFTLLVIASLIVLGIIMVFVLAQNNKFIYQHHRHDFHNGMAQHLAQ